jgi:hypothetical protein
MARYQRANRTYRVEEQDVAITRTTHLFMPRRAIRHESAMYQQALRAAADRRARRRGGVPPNSSERNWCESEARAVIGRHLTMLDEGGDGAGGCWGCNCSVAEGPDDEKPGFVRRPMA